MDDLLLTLAVPAVVLASGVYAVCDCRRQRRKPPPYARRAAVLAARETVDRAEAVVDRAYAALGRLYADPATPHPADGSPTVRGGAGSSRDRGPFRPASARRP
ncbi:hypothetical protein ACWCQM_12310 [Streptomyces sp. NPDC002125]